MPALAPQGRQDLGAALADDAGDGTGVGRKLERDRCHRLRDDALGDADAAARGGRRRISAVLAQPALVPGRELRVVVDDAVKRAIGPAFGRAT